MISVGYKLNLKLKPIVYVKSSTNDNNIILLN